MRIALVIAQAGGGSSSYGGGGGSSGGGSFGGSGGSSGEGDPLVAVLVFGLVALFVVWGIFKAARVRKKRREREIRTHTASAAAAEDDSYFHHEDVERDAAELFKSAQRAWHERDRDELATLIGADLMVEWRRRLDDFDSKGWHNQVEVKSGPEVEYVGITNREDDTEDRAVVRLSASLRAVVVDRDGNVIKKNKEASEIVDVAEYWTLARRGDGWICVSIEQDAEGAHHLDRELVPTPWMDDTTLRDEAIVERAREEAVPEGTNIGEALLDVDFLDEAHKAALDLSAVDERFAPHVLEVAARRAVAAWAEAIDGEDDALLEVADKAVARDLLYGGDESETTRTVVRGPRLEGVTIVALDRGTEPPSFTVETKVTGRRYVENRDTLALISGSKDDDTTFTERWRLILGDDRDNPWRIAEADRVSL